jgi:hypothetical protein
MLIICGLRIVSSAESRLKDTDLDNDEGLNNETLDGSFSGARYAFHACRAKH